MEDVLKSGHYKSSLEYDNVDWFVNEVIKSENKMVFYFKILMKISLLHKKMKIIEITIFADFVKKRI